MANLGTLNVDVVANTSQFQRSMNRVQQTMQKVGSKVQDIGRKMTAAITLPILAIGTSALKSAMDLEATEAKYKTVFGNMTSEADNFIKKFKELTPITKASARSMASGIQDLLIPMGFLRKDATKLTGQFTHVIGALTNFNSATHSAEDVAAAFQGAITGEYDSLKALGIQLGVEQVKLKAVEMGLTKTTKNVTKQMQAIVLLDQAYKQSGDALAAYNKESLDTLTKLKLLTAKLQDTSAELATKFLPTIIKIIDKINILADRFSNLSPTMQNIIIIVGLVAAAIGPLLVVVGALITALSAITIPMLVIAGKVALVIAALVALGAIFTNLYKTNEKFRDKINKAWNKISKTVIKIAKQIGETFSTLWGIAKVFWDKFGGLIGTVLGVVLDIVINIFDNIAKTISGAFDGINGTLQIFLGLFTGSWKKAWIGILNIAKGTLKTIDSLLGQMGIKLDAFASGIDALSEKATQVQESILKDKASVTSSRDMLRLDTTVLVKAKTEVKTKKDKSLEGTIFGGAPAIKREYKSITDILKGIDFNLNTSTFEDFEDAGVSAFDSLNDATQRYVDTLKSQIDTFKTAFGIFDKPMIERVSGERLLVRMEAQTKIFDKWQKALDVLRQKLGAGSKLFQRLAQEGPQSAGQIIGLAGLSTEQLRKAEQLQATRGQIATGVATGLVSQQIRSEQMQPTVNLNGGVYVGDMAELANLISRELALSNNR